MTKILIACSRACSDFVGVNGMGNSEDSCHCKATGKQIHVGSDKYAGEFPEFCPLISGGVE